MDRFMILAHFSETWRFRKSEWALALILTGLGVVLTVNPDLFYRPYFVSMRGMAPQPFWALFCLIVGIARMAFLFINGALRQSPPIRCMCASASCGIWTALVIAAILNDFAGLNLAVWPVLLIFDLIVVRETAIEWGANIRRKNSEGADARPNF